MTTLQHFFIEPLDVLYLRGNKLFGDPGSFGESLVPPWPSTVAGAVRSWLLAADGVDPAAFAAGRHVHRWLGTPSQPGSFALAAFHLARRDSGGGIASLHALPADLVVHEGAGRPELRRLLPVEPGPGLASSAPLTRLAVLPQPERTKPATGYLLSQDGFSRHLAGEDVRADDLVAASDLWKLESRVGVGLDAATRRADDGKLFSAQAVAFAPGVGFVASVAGAEMPGRGTLRLGGDGRAAALCSARYAAAAAPLENIAQARRARIVLTSPGLFEQGWLPTGCDADGRFGLAGVRGRVVCAAVPRAEVASGWDLARWQPKPAQRFVPCGSVYWIEDLEASAESLGKLAERGLWQDPPHNPQRRAEGFNRFAFAVH